MATTHQPLLETPKSPNRKTLILILSLATIISSIAILTTHFIQISSTNHPLAIQICDQAHDQPACLALVSEIISSGNTTPKMKGIDLLQAFLKKSTSHLQNAINMAKDAKFRLNNPREKAALIDCVELMDLSMDRIMDSVVAIEVNPSVDSFADDAHGWLSSVLTNHVTCLDGLNGSASLTKMEPWLNELILRARTSLAIFVAISPTKSTETIKPLLKDDFPSWVTSKDRRLLQSLPKEIKADVVVAKDGSGNYKTLKEAVESAPNKSKTRYVIHVKKGTYKENVEIAKNKKNLMIVGDGMDLTVITGSLNVVDGSTTSSQQLLLLLVMDL